MEDNITFFGYHVVCLIDVLGQKQKLDQWAKLPDDEQNTPELFDVLKQSVGTVLAYRDLFLSLFKQLSQCTIPDILEKLSPQQQELYHRSKDCMVNVERFSDTFVFSSKIPNAYGDVSIMPIYVVLAACCCAMIRSLAGGIPVRGAITVGKGGVLEDGSFYGPALAEAYFLESKVSNYPRVIVSPTVRSILAAGQAYSNDQTIAKLMNQMTILCNSLIWQDIDSCWIVDFLGQQVQEILGIEAEKYSLGVKEAYEFVVTEAERFRKIGDIKLALRYHLLQEYIESRLSIWGVLH